MTVWLQMKHFDEFLRFFDDSIWICSHKIIEQLSKIWARKVLDPCLGRNFLVDSASDDRFAWNETFWWVFTIFWWIDLDLQPIVYGLFAPRGRLLVGVYWFLLKSMAKKAPAGDYSLEFMHLREINIPFLFCYLYAIYIYIYHLFLYFCILLYIIF